MRAEKLGFLRISKIIYFNFSGFNFTTAKLCVQCITVMISHVFIYIM